jgi:hypothetical protein
MEMLVSNIGGKWFILIEISGGFAPTLQKNAWIIPRLIDLRDISAMVRLLVAQSLNIVTCLVECRRCYATES